MEFSQTFNLGNSTLADISKEEKALLCEEKQIKSPKDIDIIDESPTNYKLLNKTVSRTAKYREKINQTQSRSNSKAKGALKKCKSDSFLNGNGSSENLSDYFKSDFSCNNWVINTSKSCNKEDAEDLFDDSDAFSEALKLEKQKEVQNRILGTNKDSVRKGTVCSNPSLERDSVWGLSTEFDKFDFSKEDHIKPDVEDSVINIEDISFVSFKEDADFSEKQVFLRKELDLLKNGVSKILREGCELPKTSTLTSITFQSNQSLSDSAIRQDNSTNSSFCDLDTFSNCDKTLLNWSASSKESPVQKDQESDVRKHTAPIKVEQLKNITAWNLPPSIVKEYVKKGISTMFDWQVECLSNPKVLFEHKNLVYSAPTSAGKTLVSELLVIKTVLERKKKVIIILPFISVVREKMHYLQDLLTSSGYRVEGFFGGYSPPGGFESINVAICTIEKANSIVNKLLEHQNLDTIGAVVIDEVHLISDPGRGYILELLLAKMLYITNKYSLKIQMITMSATLSNAQLLQKWLNAEFYVTNFRPVELREMIKIGRKVYDNAMTFVRELDVNSYKIPNDPDNIAYLCIETILEDCSVVVFCPSKDWCETLCVHLASSIYNLGISDTDIGQRLRKNINKKAIEEIKLELKDSPIGLDSVLEKTISFACAFHHAGLTTEERDIIETSFKSGVLRVIVATSTLSSGVNLPARRVIIRSPLFAGKPMNSLTYKQMIGRAGRTGKDTLGESILICNENNSRIGRELLSAELKPLFSCLDLDNSTHLKRALLEVISSGVATTKSDLENFISCTLLKVQKEKECNNSNSSGSDKSVDNPINDSLNFLLEYEFIRIHKNDETNDDNYIATRLGMACLASSMPPSDGLILFSELQKSRKCFVLESELHAVYLVTPYSVCYQLQELDWLDYLDMWEKLSPAMKRVGELVGVKESFLVRAMRGNTKLDYKLLQIHKRFYTALALQELVNETPINQVATKFKCSRGLLQSLQQMSSTFAGIVTSFCNSLNWTMLGLIVSQFKDRLYFGVHRNLIDLMRIPDLNSVRARALFNAGIKSLVDLANSDVLAVEKILFNCISFETAKKKDDEEKEEADKRNDMRNLYVTGKTGITVKDAAKMLISEARTFLQYEIGVRNINWNQTNLEESTVKPSLITSSCQSSSLLIGKRKSEENLKSLKRLSPKIRKNKGMNGFSSLGNDLEINSKKDCNYENSDNAKPEKPQKDIKGNFSIETSPPEENSGKRKFQNTKNEEKQKKHTEKIEKTGCRKSPRILLKETKIRGDVNIEADQISSNKENNSSENNIINLDDSSFNIKSQLLIESEKSKTRHNAKMKKMPHTSKMDRSMEEINNSQLLGESQQLTTKNQSSRILRSKRMIENQNNKGKAVESEVDGAVLSHSAGKNEKSSTLEISDLLCGNSILRNPIKLNSSHILNTSKVEINSASFTCLHIIDICGNFKLFEAAVEEIKNSNDVGFSVGVEKFSEYRRPKIGSNLLINQQNSKDNQKYEFVFDECYYIAGISLTVADNVVLYMNMQSENCSSEITKELKVEILNCIFKDKNKIFKIMDAKEHLKAIKKAIPSFCDIKASIEDPKVASWLLQPDTEMNFSQLALQFAPECSALADLVSKGRTNFSIGLNSNSAIKGKIRSAVESCVTLHIFKGQLENLERIGDGQLKKFFHELEMPLQLLLFRMERLGFPVNEIALGNLSQTIFDVMKIIEKKIYEIHGSRFNLSSSSAVARVLGLHKKSNGRYCTSKQILEKIDSPIADLILNYRKLSVTLSKNIQPLLKSIVNNRIHGNSITFTATGRISMHEPNLQNVTKEFEITVPGSEKITISPRNPFYPDAGRCLISADFCQLEMRILTHLSQDPVLIKVMNSEKDVFTAIAAKWNKISEDEVSNVLRNGTKQICYGIIYGMGMKSLAESLKCTEEEAMTISDQFHLAYPGIRTYTQKVIKYAQQKGYVETITGRRRYLDHINSPETSLRGQAERQAVNTTIQGSAADIAKNAILRMERNLTKYSNKLEINLQNDSQSEVSFVLHLHDELIFEVPESKVNKVAKALKITMENCVQLNVPLRVKLKMGKSWGTLQEINV